MSTQLTLRVAVIVVLSGGLAAQSPPLPATLSLAEALRLAEERNPALAAARVRLLVAQSAPVTARERLNPVFATSMEGIQFEGPPGAGFFDRQELSLRVDQEIETAGRRGLRIEASERALDRARAVVDNERRRLRLEVSRAYFQVVLARADAEAAGAALDEIDRVIAVNRARYQSGEISGGELRRLEVERMRFVEDVLTADLAGRNARSLLLSLVGADRLDLPVDPVETLAPEPVADTAGAAAAPLDAEALRRQALAARPDLAAARHEEVRADADSRLQRALGKPNVTVGAGYRRDFGENGLILGVSLPLPILARNTGEIARADADRRLAASERAVAESLVSLEVQQAINLVEISRARLGFIEREYLKSARESRDIVLAAYRLGAADVTDFLDAERALREAQRTYHRALYEHRVYRFQLEAAVSAPEPPAAAAPGARGERRP